MSSAVDMAKTHEILARYRPIAPKPLLTPQACPLPQAPFHQQLSLRTRSCRTRKRGRVGGFAAHVAAAVVAKRQKVFSPVAHCLSAATSAACRLPIVSLQASKAFEETSRAPAELLTLTLLPTSPNITPVVMEQHTHKPSSPLSPLPMRGPVAVPVERDLLQKLQKPKVISPQPLRPVSSSITVMCIKEETFDSATSSFKAMTAEEVEAAVEAEVVPTVVSDNTNKVRLANCAYKEMIGQPECPWLDCMVGFGPSTRRINGEIVLELSGDFGTNVQSTGFACRGKIEWIRNGQKTVVDAPCEVTRLCCDVRDYMFAWKFYRARATVSKCKV